MSKNNTDEQVLMIETKQIQISVLKDQIISKIE